MTRLMTRRAERWHRVLAWICVALLMTAAVLATSRPAAAESIADPAMERVWARTDQLVDASVVSRTWMWGPEPFTAGKYEAYQESPGGQRLVQYFDKSRMEVTDPTQEPNSDWYVTNGLLVVEMMTGKIQVGAYDEAVGTPAWINVAGDMDDPTGPTYATFGRLMDALPAPIGSLLTQRVDRSGNIVPDPVLGTQVVTAATYVPETRHAIASPFWEFMQSTGLVSEGGVPVTGRLFPNPFYATGFPVSEPYWAAVRIGGQIRDVLLQCFERRCLTYTPSNPQGWQVEAGNVGRHYYAWRYEGAGNPPDDGVPRPGALLYHTDLTDYGFESDDVMQWAYVNGVHHVRMSHYYWGWFGLWDQDHGDISITGELRTVTHGTDSEACINTFDQITWNEYVLCINGIGETYAWYLDGRNRIALLEPAIRPGTNPPTLWNALRILFDGREVWFFANDTVLGHSIHEGDRGTTVAIRAANLGDFPAEMAFRSVSIHDVAD